MNEYYVKVQIDDEELKEIFKALDEAKETIYNCYSRLAGMKICTVAKKEDAASGN